MSKINYKIAEPGVVTVKVVDIIGTEVKILENDHEEPGTFEVDLEGESFPIGKYYYKIFLKNKDTNSEELNGGSLLSSGQFKVN